MKTLFLLLVSLLCVFPSTVNAQNHRGGGHEGFRGGHQYWRDARPYTGGNHFYGYRPYVSTPYYGYGNDLAYRYNPYYFDYRYPAVELNFGHSNDGCRKVKDHVTGQKGLVCTEANGDHKYFPVQ